MNEPPTADFDVSANEYTVEFTNNSTDSDGEITSYKWEFGDGDQSTEINPTHTYDQNSTYPVTLTVTDDAGATDSTTMDVSTALTTFQITVENVGSPAPILKSGAFNTPVGATSPGPAGPGEQFQFSFTARPNEIPGSGMQLSLATMFIESNDKFYAFQPSGIPLFNDDGSPIDGSVTDSLAFWDAGTEEDQEPGNGDNQPPNAPETGPDDTNNLVPVEDTNGDGRLDDDGFNYPPVANVVNVDVSSQRVSSGGYEFTVTIRNVSGQNGETANGEAITLSPGTYAAHWDQLPNGDDLTYPQFAPGEDATGTGIEDIAEDGSPEVHAQVLANLTGVTVPLSPGAYAAHSTDIQIFTLGESASEGVERIAEDGMPQTLVQGLQGNDAITDGGAFATPDGASEAGPIAPTSGSQNQSYTVTVDAAQGDVLSIGTMYIQSNDAFYAFRPEGIPLFTDSGDPIDGGVTDSLRLYDAGTEVDEEPGVGLNQAIPQSSSDTGTDEGGSVVRIEDTDDDPFLDDDGFDYLPLRDADGNPALIRVTVTPQSD